jgi:acyl-CoA hydrolase
MLLLLSVLLALSLGAQTPILRINAGGPAVTDANGTTWLADKYFVLGGTFTSPATLPPGTSDVAKTVRHGTFTYQLPLPNGHYKINLRFVEVFANYTSRVFNVTANGLAVVTELNVFQTAGGANVPITVSFDVWANNLEGVKLAFTPISKSALVSSIEVLSVEPTKAPEWCPGPVLSRMDDKRFVIGANWSAANPCHIQFNVIPPANRDPISVITYTKPIVVTVPDTATGNDEFYVWSSGPIWETASVTSKLMVGARLDTNVACPVGCTVLKQTANPRMFPQSTSPMGSIALLNGILAPKANNIMDGTRQITVGPGAAMSLTMTDGVIFAQLDPVAGQAALSNLRMEQAKTDMEVARTKAVENMFKAAPVPLQKLKNIETRLANIERTSMELEQKAAVTPEQSKQLKADFTQFQNELVSMRNDMHHQMMRMPQQNNEMMLESMHMNLQQEIGNLRSEVTDPTRWQVTPPTGVNSAPCYAPQWANDDKYYYRCTPEGKWMRMKYEMVEVEPKPKPAPKPTPKVVEKPKLAVPATVKKG